ncbi:MAG: DNA repair protein RadA [candidate division KSB1 bacterium]|nr:DNA repair protein RadA [candidate division KSB1 bacterium]
MSEGKKQKSRFVCQSCGFVSPKWLGRCTECGAWNSFVEEKVVPQPARAQRLPGPALTKPVRLIDVAGTEEPRIRTPFGEFNRVLGGGIVPGSVILVGGEPGIGKSTLMLQQAMALAQPDRAVLYVSGEESARQTKMRAERLGPCGEHLFVLAETNIDAVLEAIDELRPGLVVVDSIQTMYKPLFESAPGSISQVRECALELISLAKRSAVPVFLIGHVTKEGYLAGPKTLEHMVDTLLLFEGDRDHMYRVLRAVKNRFGSTREIGLFEMTDSGLAEVTNPSAYFLSERRGDTSGSVVSCVLEGTRPILVEIQALVAPTSYGVPQRTTSGVDHRRVALLLAVLEKRLGLRLGTFDVFVNVAGGARLDEPAADLGIAVAIASSMQNKVVDPEAVAVGEVGLGGEVRAVAHLDKRLGEIQRMGFARALVPSSSMRTTRRPGGLDVVGVERVDAALKQLLT